MNKKAFSIWGKCYRRFRKVAFDLFDCDKCCKRLKKTAFTLAEVLIVISIIGIIAETTIPELYSNYQKAVTVSQLKNTYSMLNQALKASIADNGDVSEWDYVGNSDVIGAKYLLPYLKKVSTIKTEAPIRQIYNSRNSSDTYYYDYMAGWYGYYLTDGTFINFANYFPGNVYDWSMNYSFYITVDLNGLKKGPNRAGHDVFTFLIPTEKSNAKNRHLNTILPAVYFLDSDNILTRTDGNSCTGKDKSTVHYAGAGCLKVIIDDGWQITDRYPWW